MALILVTILTTPALLGLIQPLKAETVNPASSTCFAVDGQFTHCTGGPDEWSDVTPASFPGSFLYAVDRNADPTRPANNPSAPDTLFLMYDEVGRITALGPDEFVTVNFKNVDTSGGTQVLEHYTVHIFGDNTFILLINDVVQGPGRVSEVEDSHAAAGFGTSPNSATPHVMAEFSIGLASAGFRSYSQDPLFWSSGFPEQPDLKCYSIATQSAPPGKLVMLVDQFGTENVTVGAPKELCISAIKNNEPINFQYNVKCYVITLPSGSLGPAPGVTVDVKDQFQEQTKPVGQPSLLCANVQKSSETPAPVPLPEPTFIQIDLKCYQFSGNPITSTPPINIRTEFGNESQVSVGAPDRLCLSVTKIPGGSTPPSPLDNLHYVCYAISGTPDNHQLTLQDQFGTESPVTVGAPTHFCANALKRTDTHTPPPGTVTQPDLKCYAISDKSPGKTVDLSTKNFGAEFGVQVGSANALCVTVIKNNLQPAFQIDFKCYSITGKGPNVNVTLLDQFGTESPVNVTNPYALCSAVAINAGPTVLQTVPPIDLKCYSIRAPRFAPQTAQLKDRFEPESVQITNPFGFCESAVKSIQTTAGTVAPPNQSPLDLAYKCYQIIPPSTPRVVVNLQDQFGPGTPNLPLGQSLSLCAAANKITIPPPTPLPVELGLKCYNITPAHTPTATSGGTVSIFVADQFGNESSLSSPEQVTIGSSFGLCNAAIKAPTGQLPVVGVQAPRIDWKCYTVQGPTPKATIDLRDQFGPVTNLNVGPAFAYCAAVIKNDQGTPAPYDLQCYPILGPTPNVKVDTADEFHTETGILVGQAVAVCTAAVAISPTRAIPFPVVDYECYNITGGTAPAGAVVSLSDRFGPEPSVQIGQPYTICTNAQKVLHLLSPDSDGDGVPNNIDNCVFIANANQNDTTKSGFSGVGLPCQTTHATAALLQVSNSTHVTLEGTSLSSEPSIKDEVMMIVDFRCGSNTICRQMWAHNLLESQVTLGLLTPSQESVLEGQIVGGAAPSFPYILPLAVGAAIILGSIAFLKRKRLSTITSSLLAWATGTPTSHNYRQRS